MSEPMSDFWRQSCNRAASSPQWAATEIERLHALSNELRDAVGKSHGDNERLRELLRECAEHFKTLREANVFIWPNHPLNPEARIAAILRS